MMVAALAFGALFAMPFSPARADNPDSPFVTDPLTGVAMDGLDPVSYFTDRDPLQGTPDFEYDWQSVPWYFASAANRDVFMRSPTVYMPQFGGHATTAMANGTLSDGNPHIYYIVAKRLYLFYSSVNRDAFMLQPGPIIEAAAKAWAIAMPKAATTATAPVPGAPMDAAAAAAAALAGPAPAAAATPDNASASADGSN